LLIVIKLVAEQNLLPDGDIFRLIIATLLGFLLVESLARVIMLLRQYRRDEAASATVTQPAGAWPAHLSRSATRPASPTPRDEAASEASQV
jgi:hypothetical protein